MRIITLLTFLFFYLTLNAQETLPDTTTELVRTANIKRIQSDDVAPKIDGDPGDLIWLKAPTYGNFIQFEPAPGKACSQKTYFKLMYDDNAIYVYARMVDSAENILKELAQRDQYNNTDFIGFIFDPYAAGTNGFGFYVTPRNLQLDAKYVLLDEDESWDAIWDSAVQMTDDGWQAEMRIPFSQLRFPKEDIQKWKFNVVRQMKKTREKSSWQPINPAVSGILNQNGWLEGIDHLKSPLRLSLFPYFSTYYAPEAGKKMKVAGGLDLKYGLNDAYTLDLTLIPDFGQVSFDNNVNNLSPFEVFFQERRPFFTEGLELFSRAELFYSRRIAADNNYFNRNGVPEGKTLVESPNKNKLLNAFKLTGRGSNGLAVGVFNATEGNSFATLRDDVTGNTEKLLINPVSNFNIVVFDQNLKNNSYISFINTNVMRKGSFRDANVTGTEMNIRNKKQNYFFQGSGAFSYVSEPNIAKPGYKYFLSGGKNSGNFTANLEFTEISKRFDPTDLGFLGIYNSRSTLANFAYSTYIPKGIRNRSNSWLQMQYDRMVLPNEFANFAMEAGHFFLEKNFNAAELVVRVEPVITYDYYEPRRSDFAKFYTYPTNYLVRGFISSDYRRPFAIDAGYTWREWNEPGRKMHNLSAEPRIRFNDHFSIFGSMAYIDNQNDVGFAYTNSAATDLLIPGDVVFSIRDVKTIELGLNPVVLISPTLNFSLRVRNYWSQVDYNSLHKLQADGYLSTEKVTSATYPANVLAQFTNFEARATWRFAGGSDLILAWNSGYNYFENEDARYWKSYNNFTDKIKNNLISIRVNYFLDYERMFKRKA